MSSVYPINFISKEVQRLSSQSAMLAQEAATNKRNIRSISPANIIVTASENQQLTALSGAYGSIVSALQYLQIANDGLQEQQKPLQSALNLTAQVIADPSMQTPANLAIANNQLRTLLGQIQTVVNVTQDTNGVDILSNTPFSFAYGAAANLQYLINNTGNTIGQASFAAATPDVVNAAIIANLTGLGITNTAMQATIAQNLTDAANVATANTGTVAEYLSYAIFMIPTIAIPPSQIQLQLNDAIRAEQLLALLPQVLVDSGLYSGVALTGRNPPSTVQNYGSNVVAAMTNTFIHDNTDNPVYGGWGFYDAGTPPRTPASIAFANLLTTAEKNAMISDALDVANGGTGAFANEVYGQACALNHYDGASPIPLFLRYITSFTNIDPTRTTILSLADPSPSGIITNTVEITGGAATSATDLQARYTTMQSLIYNYAIPQIAVNSYPLTAALNIINSTPAATKPIVQIGANPSDILSLQINNTSIAALNIEAINIASIPYAQIAQIYLQNAIQLIASSINSINGQVSQLNERTNTINVQIDSLQDQIDAIENTDLTANAYALSGVKIAMETAGVLMKINSMLKAAITISVKNILTRSPRSRHG